jgi:NitT/TauT family transport system substrate-binding protein
VSPTRTLSRRDFLQGLTAAGTATLLGTQPVPAAAEPPPETTRIRITRTGAVCVAPLLLAEEVLHSEGFTDIQYVPSQIGLPAVKTVGAGKTDFNLGTAGQLITRIEAGDPIVILGIHVGCYELFGTERIRSIRDLKGRTVAVDSAESGHYFMLAAMLAYIGLSPRRDVNVVTQPFADSVPQLGAVRSMAWSPFRRRTRSFARNGWDTSSSALSWTARGRNTSVACGMGMPSSSGNIPSPPSE